MDTRAALGSIGDTRRVTLAYAERAPKWRKHPNKSSPRTSESH